MASGYPRTARVHLANLGSGDVAGSLECILPANLLLSSLGSPDITTIRGSCTRPKAKVPYKFNFSKLIFVQLPSVGDPGSPSPACCWGPLLPTSASAAPMGVRQSEVGTKRAPSQSSARPCLSIQNLPPSSLQQGPRQLSSVLLPCILVPKCPRGRKGHSDSPLPFLTVPTIACEGNSFCTRHDPFNGGPREGVGSPERVRDMWAVLT